MLIKVHAALGYGTWIDPGKACAIEAKVQENFSGAGGSRIYSPRIDLQFPGPHGWSVLINRELTYTTLADAAKAAERWAEDLIRQGRD